MFSNMHGSEQRRMTAGNDIVLGSEDASHGRYNAESGEVSAGNQFDWNSFRLLPKERLAEVGKRQNISEKT